MSVEVVDVAVAAALPHPRRRSAVSGASIVTVIALLWILAVLAAAAVPGLLAPDDPTQLQSDRVLQAPGATPLGTDQYGRSVLTLLVHGAGTAMLIGLLSTLVALVIGGALGLVAGYAGGVLDMLIGRLVDVLMCFPGVLLALVIATALGPTTTNLIIAVGIAAVPSFARVMRGQVLSVRSRLFIEAARSNGFGQARILLRHVLPNSLTPMVVLATVSVGTAIVVAASLSFLGLGPKSDVPDWGQLLATGQPYLSGAWWISTFAGLTLTLTVIAISLLGDWLRDRMDTD